MRQRTKRKLTFYLSLVGVVALTIVVGLISQYLIYLGSQLRLGFQTIRYDLYITLAAILFIMCISDIYLFFHLIVKRR